MAKLAKNQQNSTSRMLDVKTFQSEVMRVISGFHVCRLTPKVLQHHPDTKYTQKQKCHV